VALAALVLYALWFALAFGVRTLVAVRRTGDWGFRGVSGAPLSLQWCAGVLFVVALLVGVAAPSPTWPGCGRSSRAARSRPPVW
jgi:hypothetical protein